MALIFVHDLSLQDCWTSTRWSSMRRCRVPAGETRPALTGITQCSCSSAVINSVRTATWSWADGSLPSAGQNVGAQQIQKDHHDTFCAINKSVCESFKNSEHSILCVLLYLFYYYIQCLLKHKNQFIDNDK